MHMNDGRVVSNFVLQALQNESITVKYCFFVKINRRNFVDLWKWKTNTFISIC